MSCYEAAPACELVATSCACCSRPLVDAISVETGVGPVCRETHGYAEAQGPADWTAAQHALRLAPGPDPYWLPDGWNLDARRAANVLVHRIAAEQEGTRVNAFTEALRALGFTTLAGRIASRLAKVQIELDDGDLVVRAPYSPESVQIFRGVPGRRWDKAKKANRFPLASKRAVWSALREAYPGAVGNGPRGLFLIGRAA